MMQSSVRAAVGFYALSSASALKADIRAHVVNEVTPESFEMVKAKGVNTDGMNKLHIVAWDGDAENITIMGYPKEQDKEVSGALDLDGHWEARHTRDLCRPWQKLHKRGVFLDVGANIGTYSLPMAACTKHTGNGTVLSIEGMPSIAEHFRAGIIANNAENVALYPYAVGSEDGPDSVTMLLDPENKGGSSVAGNKAGDPSVLKSGIQEVQVPLAALDTMVAGDARFKAVLSAKIDIEGNEGRFFNGAQAFFFQHPPCYLMVELIPEWLQSAGTPVEGILESLKDWGYDAVPSADFLRTCKWTQRTIHVWQKELDACYGRVEAAYAKL